MKKYLLITVLSITLFTAVRAQEYKVNKTNGKIIVRVSAALIEGYDGKEIIFSLQHKEAEAEDPKAKGLQTINGSGYSDNTGLGISVVENGTTMEVNQVLPNLAIKIMVPKTVIISFVCHKMAKTGKAVFRNLQNEIEVETDDNDVSLENVTGPVLVRTLYGAVDAVFSEPIKGPVSIASIHGAVDVAIPVSTKANLKLQSGQSTIMASADFNIQMEKNQEYNTVGYGNMINGKLNGGGTDFRLSSQYGKIYLRKTNK